VEHRQVLFSVVFRIISIVSLGCGSGAGSGNSGILATREEAKEDCCGYCGKVSISARGNFLQTKVWVSFSKLYSGHGRHYVMAPDVATFRKASRHQEWVLRGKLRTPWSLQISLHEARLITKFKSIGCDWLKCSRNGSWRKAVARRHSRDVNGVDPNASCERDAGWHGDVRSVAKRSGIWHRAFKVGRALASSPSIFEIQLAFSHTRLTRH
jgi:hypothetical protein